MNRRTTPEADAQRAIVQALRFALPRDGIVHHCANEVTEPGSRGQIRQSILVGMGVHTGFADLIVISGGRVLFLEVKSQTGRLRKSQEVFRDTVCAQGFGWAVVRSVDDALGALADNGFTSRVRSPARRAAP
jgi:hypothetical protein